VGNVEHPPSPATAKQARIAANLIVRTSLTIKLTFYHNGRGKKRPPKFDAHVQRSLSLFILWRASSLQA
jgi:hypothetical protein